MDGSTRLERPKDARPGESYKHYRGRLCRVVGVARLAHKGQWLVVYDLERQPEYLLAMPLGEFLEATLTTPTASLCILGLQLGGVDALAPHGIGLRSVGPASSRFPWL